MFSGVEAYIYIHYISVYKLLYKLITAVFLLKY